MPELIILIGMLVVSTYMLLESFAFTYEVGLFPRFAALVTICGVLLLLFQNYLPESVRDAIDDSGSVFDYEESDFAASDEQTDEQRKRDELDREKPGQKHDSSEQEKPQPKREIDDHPSLVTSAARRKQAMLVGLLLGYGAIGYIVGLVLATPLFVLAYSIVFSIRKRIAGLLLALALAIAFVFNHILPVDLARGGL